MYVESADSAWFRKRTAADANIIDIGANIGLGEYLFLRTFPSLNFAIEHDAANCHLLERPRTSSFRRAAYLRPGLCECKPMDAAANRSLRPSWGFKRQALCRWPGSNSCASMTSRWRRAPRIA